MLSYPELKTFIQWTSFIFSVGLNSLLILLILTKSPKKMGNYRYLMIYFSCFAIFFSTVDVLVGPFIHTFDKSFCVLVDMNNSWFGDRVVYVLICVLCGCFGVTITFFAIHFVFRYFALERKGRLSYFHGSFFALWLGIPVFVGIVWGSTVAYFLWPTEETTEYLRKSVLENYGLNMENVTFVGAVYWRKVGNGKEEIVMSTLIGSLIFAVIMVTSFSVVCYYGVLSYKRITNLVDEGESEFTKNLQKQLYKALVVQTLIPISLMYFPVGNYFIFPAFGVNIAPFSKLITFLYAAYPAVDPLPLLFIIDNYRIAIKEYFFCFVVKNQVGHTDDNTSREQHTI